MSLSAPKAIFGIHSVTPYKLDGSGEFYGTLKVLSGSSLELTGDQVKLTGGSNRYTWAVENGSVESSMSLKFSEYPAFVWELFFGKAPTVSSAQSLGEVSALQAKKGLTVTDSVTGVSAIPTSGAQSLKVGKYLLKAVSSTVLKVYHSTDLDHARGIDAEYRTDLLEVTEVTLQSGSNDIASLGIRLTGASMPALVAGDTASFEVLPPYAEKMEVVVGGSSDSTPEFGAIVMAEKRGDNSIVSLDVFKCRASGMGLSFDAKAFSASDVKVDCLYSPEKNGVFKFLSVKALP